MFKDLISLIPQIVINKKIEEMSDQVSQIDRKTDETNQKLSQILSNLVEKRVQKLDYRLLCRFMLFYCYLPFPNDPYINYVSVGILLIFSIFIIICFLN